MTDRSDPWDSRPSTDPVAPGSNGTQYHHLRQISSASASDILNQPHQHPDDSLSNDYGYKSSYYNAPEEKLDNDYYSAQPPPPHSNSSDGYYQTSYPTRPAHTGGLI